MCLILLAWQVHPDFPLVVAANRDEFFQRPTQAAQFWEPDDEVLAGRDLQGGGTWMGFTRGGRFAALTNYRDPTQNDPGRPSRGALVADFLCGASTPADYIAQTAEAGRRCNGYNLLVGDLGRGELLWSSNLATTPERLTPGIHGVSNHLLNTPWPKVGAGRTALERALWPHPDAAALLALLQDATPAPDADLPDTGIPLEWERALSAAFIRRGDYGTRSSTVLIVAADGQVRFEEITWPHAPTPAAVRRFEFNLR